jgi:8-oxo-dGTP pyrophosphatase MutT (NUDIX family)
MSELRKAVNIILRNDKGEILAVSRKDNKELFGLPGGKVDPEDNTLEEAIAREVFQETGLEVFNLKIVDSRPWGKNETFYQQNCFVGDWKGTLTPQEELDAIGETGVVKWVSKSVLENGFFGDYNQIVFAKINLGE